MGHTTHNFATNVATQLNPQEDMAKNKTLGDWWE